MSKREAFIIGLIITLFSVLLFGGEFIPYLGYDHKEFDYSSGKTRVRHRSFGFTHSTNYQDTWITEYTPAAQTPDWRLMRYVNSPGAPSINTKSGQLYSLIKTMGTMLDDYSADDHTHKLVADYIFDLLNQTQSDPSIHYDVIDNFLYFTDNFSYPHELYGTVTYEQVLQTIDRCTSLSQPSTISP